MQQDLFKPEHQQHFEQLCDGASVLRGFANTAAPSLLAAIDNLCIASPFRHMATRSGFKMSVAMTNCGRYGWVSDRKGYRYETKDPLTGQPWPQLPESYSKLASSAALAAGYPAFIADACLINRYEAGSRMGLHQDQDEADLAAPIVSVSLGIPACFLFGGPTRKHPVQRIILTHGDVVVWGGPARLYFHGIAPIKAEHHPLTDSLRFNLTFRKVY